MGANGKKEATTLVKRCEAVGWQVVRTGTDHYKVDTRRGTFTIPTTPSDYRSMRNTLAEAKRYGLEELEAKVVAAAESDRRKRINDDRTTNDAKLARIAQVNGATIVQSEVKDSRDVGFGLVNGVVIVAVAQAMVKTPVMAKPAPLADAEELLLVDGRVLYRCTKNSDDGTSCHSVFDSANSVRSHIRFHTPRDAAEPKPERSTVTKTSSTKLSLPSQPTATDEQESLIKKAEELAAALNDAGVGLTKLYDEIGGKLMVVRNAHVELITQLKAFKPEITEPDPALVEKAAKFDALRGLMQ